MSPAARARRDALRDIGGRGKEDDDDVKATDADREKADRNIINKLKKAADVRVTMRLSLTRALPRRYLLNF